MTLSRRQFLTVGGSAVVCLVTGARPSAAANGKPADMGLPWITITADNRVAVLVDKCEMGQGVRDLYARIVARELNVPPETILVDDAPVGHRLRNQFRNQKFPAPLLQITGYSSSTADAHAKLVTAARRLAGALRRGAAVRLGESPANLTLKEGCVTGRTGSVTCAEAVGRRADATARCEPAPVAPLTGYQRIDARDKVTGRARFGIDVDETELGEKPLVAMMIRPDRPDDELELATDADDELVRLFGARVVRLPRRKGIAVVASSFWHAQRAQQHARAWVRPSSAPIDPVWGDSDKTLEAYRKAAGGGRPVERDGRSKVSDLVYQTPYGAHAPLEPMTAACRLLAGVYHVWTATQFPPGARALVVDALQRDGATGVGPESVEIHGMLAGGSFGRRTTSDYVVEAARICRALKGQAVKLIWTRDEDFRHDYLRPCTVNRVTARLTDGRVAKWTQRIAARSPNYAMVKAYEGAALPVVARVVALADDHDPTYAEGIAKVGFARRAIAYNFQPSPQWLRGPGRERDWHPRVGYWRSVNFFHTIFAAESTIDDLAFQADLNPVDFRLGMLGESPRLAWCLERVAPKASRAQFFTPRQPRPGTPDRGHGVACYTGFNSFAALAVEVRVDTASPGRSEIRVVRAVAAVDCGPLWSEDIVKQQVEGGIVFGLSAALKPAITLVGGVVQERNFDQCDPLRMYECPRRVDVICQDRHDRRVEPTGVGELMVPLVAPAVANAVFNLERQRLVRLPLTLEGSPA